MNYIYIILIGYLLGSSSMAYYVSRIKHIDLQATGSKNLGASNTVVSIGKTAGVVVAIHDILKSIIAVILVQKLFPATEYAGAIAGCASILGHMYPFYLKFKGGKGFACYVGMNLALNWKFGILMIFIIIAVAYLSNYIIAGTFSTMILSPIVHGFLNGIPYALVMGIVSLIMFTKHIENINRIKNKTEHKIFVNRKW